ncbi:MAG TPA: galactokinase family protein [Candidatus Nitrosocosmicus sp.]|nr:galactokinase family protein [Candidatus Nitrosocosmicus sp.]
MQNQRNRVNNKLIRLTSLDPSIPDRIHTLQRKYQELYGDSKTELTTAYSPGRAEVLGNHTDYNEGYTLSTNTTYNLLITGTTTQDNTIQIVSLNQGKQEPYSFKIGSIDELEANKSEGEDSWTNYIKGVVWALTKRGHTISGFNAVIQSTIPLGAGVSSSAAIELATVHLITELTGQTINSEELLTICKDAENNYVGAPSGYLDQATEELADDGMLFISYRQEGEKPFTWEKVSADLKSLGHAMVVGYDPESKHAIGVGSKYAQRKDVCVNSLPLLQKLLQKNVTALRDVTVEDFEKIKNDITDEKTRNYIQHVIYDNQRVLDGVQALKKNDIELFGKLMTESGKSSIELYELAEETPELTWVYNTTLENSEMWGLSGVRNMGGGFNATTLALMEAENVETYIKELNKMYQNKFGREYKFINFVPAPSAGILS